VEICNVRSYPGVIKFWRAEREGVEVILLEAHCKFLEENT
jgi:hypothetical protein